MELEEMKVAWNQMSEQLKKQELLTNQLIIQMTRTRYKNKFSKLTFYESIGSLICLAMAIYLLFNFKLLDTWYLILLGGFSIGYLLVIPFIVLNSIYMISNLNLVKNTYKQTLTEFAKRKKRLLLIQKIGIWFNFLLLLSIFPVTSKIFDDKDLIKAFDYNWLWFILIFSLLMIAVSRWGFNKYKRLANAAEEILNDLSDESVDKGV